MAPDPTIQAASSAASIATSGSTSRSGGLSFRGLLSDLNPLQYIPVVGAIYRAVTGDEGNPTLRFAASLGTSFALGGPVGVGITIAEKVTGIDPEKIGRHLLAGLFHSGSGSASGATATTGTTAIAATSRPWSKAELSAYGVKSAGGNELTAGSLQSADVLNTLELRRLATGYA